MTITSSAGGPAAVGSDVQVHVDKARRIVAIIDPDGIAAAVLSGADDRQVADALRTGGRATGAQDGLLLVHRDGESVVVLIRCALAARPARVENFAAATITGQDAAALADYLQA